MKRGNLLALEPAPNRHAREPQPPRGFGEAVLVNVLGKGHAEIVTGDTESRNSALTECVSSDTLLSVRENKTFEPSGKTSLTVGSPDGSFFLKCEGVNMKTGKKQAAKECPVPLYHGAHAVDCVVSHTPGPWQLGGWGIIYGPGLPPTTDGRLPTALEVAVVSKGRDSLAFPTKEAAQANARLIAAAPELLAALKDAAHIIQQYAFYAERMRVNGRGFFPESRLGIGDNPAGNVLAAIAKAEGK